jgi:hypothetical protein
LTEPFRYRPVPDDDVEPGVLEKAKCVLNYCDRVLGLSGVRIQWVRPMTKTEVEVADIVFRIFDIFGKLGGGERPAPEYKTMKQGEFYGAVFPLEGERTVYIRADIGLSRICGAIAHECKHLSEFGPGAPGLVPIRPEDDAASEARAEKFAGDTMRVLGIS